MNDVWKPENANCRVAKLEKIDDISCVLRPPWMAEVPKFVGNRFGRLTFDVFGLPSTRPWNKSEVP